MEKERKLRILSIGALLVAIIGLTVAFAAMSRNLIINGTASIDSAKWDIHFANPLLKSKKGDAREVSAPVISEDGGDLTLKVGLRKPQDEIVYNVDVENSGDIDAEITRIDYPELSEEHAKIIEFEAVYDDGSSIALSQALNAGDSKKVKITIRFKDIEDESLLASTAYDVPLTFKIHYTQSGVSGDSGSGSGGSGGSSGSESNSAIKVNEDGTVVSYNAEALTNDEGYVEIPALDDNGNEIKSVDLTSFAQYNASMGYLYNEATDEEIEAIIIYDEENKEAIEELIMQSFEEDSGSGSYSDNKDLKVKPVSFVKKENDSKIKKMSSSGSDSYEPPKVYTESEWNAFIKEQEVLGPVEVEYEYVFVDINAEDLEDAFLDPTSQIEKIDFTNATHLETIGEYTFAYSLLKEIKLNSNLKEIGEEAFAGTELTKIDLPEGLQSIGSYAFSNSQLQGTLIISDSVTYIGDSAFSNNQLNRIEIGNGVERIEDNTFKNNQLTEGVKLPANLTYIGYSAFYNSSISGEVIIPKTVTAIRQSAFSNCNITSVNIPSSVTQLGSGSSYGTPFENNPLIKLSINMASIPSYSFGYNDQISDLTIGSNVEYIDASAFSPLSPFNSLNIDMKNIPLKIFGYRNVENLIIGSNVETMAEGYFDESGKPLGVFAGNKITNLTIPSNVKTMGQYAFYGNKNTLETLNIDMEIIPSDVFNYVSISNLNLGDNVKVISERAFGYNYELKSVRIPKNVISIEDYAFTVDGVIGGNITELTFAEDSLLQSIGSYAFQCHKLEEIIIPSSVTSIGDGAFGYNSNLTTITIKRPDSTGMNLGTRWNGSAQIVYDPN